jgi:O-antigen biosynthesis protein
MKLIPETYNLTIPYLPQGSIPVVPSVFKSLLKKQGEAPALKLPGDGLNRAVNFYADYGGCGFWRMLWPELMLNWYQKAVVNGGTTMILDPSYYKSMKAVKLQRQATPVQLQFVKMIKEKIQPLNGLKLIYEIDDVVFRDDIPDYNRCKDGFTDQSIVDSILTIMKQMDEITVTCPYMRDYYIRKTGNQNITVVPNFPPKFWADHYDRKKLQLNFKSVKQRPRIGYTGSGTHFDIMNRTGQKDDFTHVIEAIIKTRKKYQWVFMGGYPLSLKPYIDNGEIEFHNWAMLPDYMKAVANLNVNCLIAPLEDNEFNRCKSNIKHLEAACLGIPAICQDMVTYESCSRRFTTGDEMIEQIDLVCKDRSKYMKISDQERAYANTMWLENEENLKCHEEIYFTPFGSKERTALNRFNK